MIFDLFKPTHDLFEMHTGFLIEMQFFLELLGTVKTQEL